MNPIHPQRSSPGDDSSVRSTRIDRLPKQARRSDGDRNLQTADEVERIAAEVGATPAQVALAWLLSRGDDIAPIPGTRRVERLEENVAADGVELTPQQLSDLNSLSPAVGDRNNEALMRMIDQ